MAALQTISTTAAPAAIGPYSQAVVANGMIYTAGQIPLDAATGTLQATGIKEQTEVALANLKGLLESANSDLEHVVKTTVFLKDMNDFGAMNEIYAKYFVSHKPARSAVEVARLPRDVLVEIECVALVKTK
ncbi:hypothetical protein CXG81DRAFT_15616 [Caulochytrium protostelioides]|uniref:Uncharacterized protein n=1 Tax=Caulochytrium protostelioides TaxID=1555241 RepID=A0A4P9X1E6_9FUNG|nr:hypothetical protein CXG81DRAFT_15616 [Caulochytrium protostelioides]|eukprot:RKO98658.1 hypothetical protein CXG81DRAFT_15616 [Caulochytrium protostelioides]